MFGLERTSLFVILKSEKKMARIPFNKPSVISREIEYLHEAIELGQLSGDGHFTKRCNQIICDLSGSDHTLLTHSCTAALEMAAILCDLKPGDEVIMPSFTFVSTANAVVLRGATPVFVDIDQKTLNIDPGCVAAAVTPQTKAIFNTDILSDATHHNHVFARNINGGYITVFLRIIEGHDAFFESKSISSLFWRDF